MTVSVPNQEAVTKDGVAVNVNAVLWHKVVEPILAVNAVVDRDNAVLLAAETALRNAIGQHHLDDVLKGRMKVNARLMERHERAARKWGVDTDAVAVGDMEVP